MTKSSASVAFHGGREINHVTFQAFIKVCYLHGSSIVDHRASTSLTSLPSLFMLLQVGEI